MSSKSKEIGGRDYAFGTIPATEAVFVEVAVAKAIGEPMFRALVELDTEEKSGGKIDKTKMMAIAVTAMGALSGKMDPQELINTMKTVFKYVSCEGKRVEIDATFTGRNKDLWLVFIEALKHNFSDFFPASLSDSLPHILKA